MLCSNRGGQTPDAQDEMFEKTLDDVDVIGQDVI
jgi:hypothetical protein